ncbi:MAG: hypothetical protein AAB592_00390, partial [Patescibacteria group bacterium]
EEEEFLNLIVKLVEAQKINLYTPSSLINLPVYNNLSMEQKGKVDFDAVNLLTTVRNIYNLWSVDHRPTFQIQNMVQQVRLLKERLEQISGDVYVL